jgi:hypothetical protein
VFIIIYIDNEVTLEGTIKYKLSMKLLFFVGADLKGSGRDPPLPLNPPKVAHHG